MRTENDTTNDLAGRIASFAVPRQPTDIERAKARTVVADAVVQACGLAAASAETSVIRSMRALEAASPVGSARVIGGARRILAEDAALINATLIHARLTDDAHPDVLAHPAAVIVPTVLALGEEQGAGGNDFMEAIVAGYRAMAALAAPVAERTAAQGLRNTALFGPTGAAVAAARLFRLSPARSAAAVMFALGSSGGTLQPLRTGSTHWRLQPGMAARIGIAAARLAVVVDEEDLVFREAAIEGEGGIYEGWVDGWSQADARIDVAVDGLLGVTHKLHATCGANQLAVESLAWAKERHGWVAEDIVRVDIELEPAGYSYPGCNSRGPFAAGGGFLSRPLALASVLLTGESILTETVIRRALGDPRLEGLMARIHSRARVDGPARHPQAAELTVTLADGSVYFEDGNAALERFLLPDMGARIDALPQPERDHVGRFWAALEVGPTGSVRELMDLLAL